MLRVHKIKLNPTPEQEQYFWKASGTARFAYNFALAQWQEWYALGGKPSESELRRYLNSIKEEQFPWMEEVTKNAVQQAVKNLGQGYANAFRRIATGKPYPRKKTKSKNYIYNPWGFPTFKKKHKATPSFRADGGPQDAISNAVKVADKVVTLPRCGVVSMREKVRFTGPIKSATVSHNVSGWYVAIAVDTQAKLQRKQDKGAVGVDVGIKSLAVFSDGTACPALKPFGTLEKKMVRLSRSISRKIRFGCNWQKAKNKLSRLHFRIANIRKDAIHKLTTNLAQNYSAVAIEDLAVANMVKNHHLAKAIHDCGFGMVKTFLPYKLEMTGGELRKVNQWFPSSKTCCKCSKIHDMPLDKRVMDCQCGNHIDRDFNAAINILREAIAIKPVERKALVARKRVTKLVSVKQENLDLRKIA